MHLEFLKYVWTSSSGSPKFARVARKNPAWLRPQGLSEISYTVMNMHVERKNLSKRLAVAGPVKAKLNMK